MIDPSEHRPNNISRLSVKALLFNHLLQKGIQDEATLYGYIKEFLKFQIPTESVCSHHTSPWDAVADIFFERKDSTFLFGSRSSGKTRILSILNHVEATFKPNIQIACAGAIMSQAQKNYEYTLSYYEDDLLASTLKSSIQSKTVLENGSEIMIMSSSLTAMNGQHPAKFRLDEIELIDWHCIQEGFSMTQSQHGWRAQDTMSSTRKFGMGTVQRLLDEAEQRQITVYPFCIWESVEKCTRLCKNDPVYGDCPIYSRKDPKTGREVLLCGGTAHKSSGFYKISDLIKKLLIMDANTFKSQWECQVVGDASTVYGAFFSQDLHVIPIEADFLAKFKALEGEDLNPRHQRIAGIDFGGQFACIKLIRSPSHKRRFYVLEVYFNKKDVILDTHVQHIKKMQWFRQGNEVWFGDTAARQDILEFNNKGIPVRPARKEDVFAGINLIKSILGFQEDDEVGLFINGPRCEPLITEFNSYAYKIEKSGLPSLDQVVKANDHVLDALRYALYTYLMGGFRVRTRKRGNF